MLYVEGGHLPIDNNRAENATARHPIDSQRRVPALAVSLQATRTRMAVSQVELATRHTQAFISKCKRGEHQIGAVELVDFVEALTPPPQELLGEYVEERSQGPPPRDKKTTSRR